MNSDNYPVEEAEKNQCLVLEIPCFGGHVGLVALNSRFEYRHETRVASFINDVMKNEKEECGGNP